MDVANTKPIDTDTFDETLFDGNEEEMRALVDNVEAEASYEYSEECGSFTVRYGATLMFYCKAFERPNCVDVLGSSFVFHPLDKGSES